MKDLSKYMIVTDVDDTLLPHVAKEIPTRNLEAIHRFQEEGGKFTFATGRSHFHCASLFEQLRINVPSAHNNGAYIYHYPTRAISQQTYLPHTANAYIKEVFRAFPDVNIMVFNEENALPVLGPPEAVGQRGEVYIREFHDVDKISQDWFKILFVRPAEKMQELHDYLDEHPLADCYYANSSAVFCEMMVRGIDKGEGLRKLARTVGVEIANTYAVGDYFNDVDMLRAAGVSVAVGDGAPEIREMCDLVMGPCADGAVADLIEYIERL